MAIQRLEHARICGIAACVPSKIVDNATCGLFDSVEDYRKFVSNVGVEQRRKATAGKVVESDLCCKAAEELLSRLSWNKNEIDLLVFVSQSPDYKMPATACILQHRLGLSQSCFAFDVNLGCSGWVYGIGIVAEMMRGGSFRKALLMAGNDDISNGNDTDRSHAPLFGAAGTVTAFAYDATAPEMVMETGVDGSRHQAIITPDGGSRRPFSEDSLRLHQGENGNVYHMAGTVMDGPAVFIFGISTVPRAVHDMLSLCNETVESVDYFLFHQANAMMNEKIRKKCGIPVGKYPSCLRNFGNCSSASIPLTMVTCLRGEIMTAPREILACGFGTGLSWATLRTRLETPLVLPLLEI